MKKTVCFAFVLTALLAFNVPAATAQATTQPGLFFNIVNNCSASVSGFVVGDELCLLQVGSAVYTRAIFNGFAMAPGQKQFAMACAGKDGNGSVIFVPPAGTSIQAVVVTVKPNENVAIPSTFCGAHGAAPETLFQKRKP